jgi:hypothetical protein
MQNTELRTQEKIQIGIQNPESRIQKRSKTKAGLPLRMLRTQRKTINELLHL